MYRWLFVIGLVLSVILAGGLTDSIYALDGHGRPSGHSWGGHGNSLCGWGGHGYWHHGYWGHGWGCYGRFFSPWNLLVPPFSIPVPVPVPPVVHYPCYQPYCSPYPYDGYESYEPRVWITGHWVRNWNEEYGGWERGWVPGHWSYR